MGILQSIDATNNNVLSVEFSTERVVDHEAKEGVAWRCIA